MTLIKGHIIYKFLASITIVNFISTKNADLINWTLLDENEKTDSQITFT